MFDFTEYKTRAEEAINKFKDDMKKVRTGRAHPDMLNAIKCEAYGQWMPLNQVANVTTQGASMLIVTPYDPSTIPGIAAGIRADQALDLNPSDDGHIIRVPIPPLTEERRKEIVKILSTKVEEAKIAIRNIREDARKEVKTSELPEDVRKRAEKEVDDMTKTFTDTIDREFKVKEAEIMQI